MRNVDFLMGAIIGTLVTLVLVVFTICAGVAGISKAQFLRFCLDNNNIASAKCFMGKEPTNER